MNERRKKQQCRGWMPQTMASLRRQIGKDLINMNGVTDLFLFTKKGYNYTPDSMQFIAASQKQPGGETVPSDELIMALSIAMLDSVDLRHIILMAAECYKDSACADDWVELACYRKDRMDVWKKYCEDGSIDWKVELGIDDENAPVDELQEQIRKRFPLPGEGKEERG